MKKTLLVYVVALLGCAAGGPVDTAEPLGVMQETMITCPTPVQLDSDINAASQADVISLSGVTPLSCPEVSMVETWSGGKMVFSDSPEGPTVRGRLYDDATLAATVDPTYNRVFAYHVNGKSSGNLRFAVLIKNLGTASATLTVRLKGTAGPTTSYAYAGKLAFQRWLTSTSNVGTSVPVGGYARLDTTFDTTNVAPSNLLHGIWDYSMTQPHEVIVCALNTNDNPVNVCPGLALLSRDTHQRGTFPNADKVYDTSAGVVIDTIDGIQQLPIAGGTTDDTNAIGTDVTDGSNQTLTGNYGILYRMHLSTVSSDAFNMGFLFNPRGGQWGGAVNSLAGITPGGKFLIPAGTGTTGDNTKGAVEGKYAPGAGLTVWLQFMPTGGVSFPLRYVIVPY